MSKNDLIEIWKAFPKTIFVYTSEQGFWQVLKRLTGFKQFSTYFYPDGRRAWQAIFPAKARRRIEKLWVDYSKNTAVDNQQLTKLILSKSARSQATINRVGQSPHPTSKVKVL